MIRRGGIALVVVALGGLVTPAIAGESRKFATQLTVQMKRDTGQDIVFGKVRSKYRGCETGRKVKLLHREVKWQEKWSVIARPRTNAQGKWMYEATKNSNGDRFVTPGYYHLRAGEKKISTGDGEVICKEKFSSPTYMG